MKILHIIPSLNKGGAERIALDICIELQKQGHDVMFVCLHEHNSYAFLTKQLNFKTVQTRVSLSLSGKNNIDVEELQLIIDDFAPEVIHSHLFEAEINLAFCNISKDCRRIIHFHDNMKQMRSFSFKTLLNKALLANYYERKLVLDNIGANTTAIGISKDAFSYMNENLPKRIKLEYLLNAINAKRFVPSEEVHEEFVITMIGSFVAKKGQKLAIETIHELKKRNEKVRLKFLGDGEMKKELIALAEHLELTDIIDFMGLVDYPEKHLQESSLYLHTASYEPFGLVLIEAMACGLPVVCTDGRGNRDIIQEGENGFMIWERNPLLIADKIQFLIENEAERKRIGQNAVLFAQNFGMDEYVKKLLKIYKG